MTPKSWAKKKDKLDFIKFQIFYGVKGHQKKVKTWLTNWKKIFANPISYKKFLSRKYNKLNNEKTKAQFRNG